VTGKPAAEDEKGEGNMQKEKMLKNNLKKIKKKRNIQSTIQLLTLSRQPRSSSAFNCTFPSIYNFNRAAKAFVQ
jgi:hypothetical protein